MVYTKDTNNLLNVLNKYTFQYPKINLMKNTYFLHLYEELKNIYNNIPKSDIHYKVIKNNLELEKNNFMTTEITNHCKKLKYGYAKTSIHVFYKGNIIEGADPVSFETINRKQMPDQYKKFKLNSAIGVDMDYVKKKKRIYQFGIKIFEL